MGNKGGKCAVAGSSSALVGCIGVIIIISGGTAIPIVAGGVIFGAGISGTINSVQ
jgi:hypothetical protein